MKTKPCLRLLALALLALLTFHFQLSNCLAQGTAFTYQGRLNDGGSPANGSYDLTFALFDANTGAGQVGNTLTNSGTVVSNGLFTVTLDFGAAPFDGNDRWLEVGVRSANSSGLLTLLKPRQLLISTPYAVRAANFGGAISDSQLSANIPRLDSNLNFTGAVQFDNAAGSFVGGFAGNGAGLSNVDLLTINSQGAIYFANSAATFTLASSPVVGDGPRLLTAADVNGDGKLDLINANYFDDNLTVLTNDGYGGFALASSPVVVPNSGPQEVAAADLNGDGKLDLVSASYDTNLLTILTNDGSGGFALSSTPTTGPGPAYVAVADVNGDGKLDLISADYGDRAGNTLTVLTNDGKGGFALSATLAVGLAPRSVTTTDVNGNGKVDLICANEGSNTLTVLTNDGSGGFVTAAALPVGSGPNVGPAWVTAADINADGKVDLISANFGFGLGNTLTVLTNDGSGGFARASDPVAGTGPVSLDAADVNRDGKVDLICANEFDDTVSVLTNDGSGGFALASSPTVGPQPVSVTAGDVNGDGEVDLITANMGFTGNGYTLSVLFGNRPANFVGIGTGLTDLNAASLTGTIGDARLSADVALRAGGNSFTGNQSVIGNVTVTGKQTVSGNLTVNSKVGIGTSSPVGNLDVVTGSGSATVSIRDDTSTGVAGLVMTGGAVPGTLRLRNSLEVWPDATGTTAGRLDVRTTSGTPTITLTGSSGNVRAMSFTTTSDRNTKENFAPVQPQEVLDKVAALPISTWNFKSQDPAIRHLGPMAQDFKAAFGLGATDTGIATVDEGGVALAAIQGLNQKLTETQAELKRRDAENAELKEQLNRLTRTVNKLNQEINGGAL